MVRKIVKTGILSALLFATLASTAFADSTGLVEKGVNFRSAPSVSSSVVAFIKTGSPVTVLDEINPYWLKAEYNGKIGYVSSHYVSYSILQVVPQPLNVAEGQKVVDFARSLEGKVQYQYGVRNVSTLTFDCSSFTQYVYKEALGISIPWGSKAQSQIGTTITAISDLQPGDLVFMTVGSGTTIAHVGIYMGNGDFIHNVNPASNVTVSNLNTSAYWHAHFVQGVRISH